MYLVAKPARGLLVFNTTDSMLYIHRDTGWVALNVLGSGWATTGNANINPATHFVGTTNLKSLPFRTNNIERMIIDSLGRVGIGVSNPANQLVVKDTLEIRRTGSVSQLLFSNTATAGDFRIGGDGGDIFWQGGGSRALQMGSYHATILAGDRQNAAFPGFMSYSTFAGIGVVVQGQRDGSIPLVVQANSAWQTANLTNWRNSAGAVLTSINKNGYIGIGTSTPATPLHVVGANPLTLLGVAAGTSTSADSLLTITNGLVRKIPMSTFGAGSGSVTSVSIANANGFNGTVATSTTTPAITVTTSVNGIAKGKWNRTVSRSSGNRLCPRHSRQCNRHCKINRRHGFIDNRCSHRFSDLESKYNRNGSPI